MTKKKKTNKTTTQAPIQTATTTPKTTQQTTYLGGATGTLNSYKCHSGNTAVYTEPNGGTLYIGGWNNQATFDWNTHVIDLTGTEHKYWDIPVAFDERSKDFLPFLMKSYAGWLSLPFPDYGTPKGMSTRQQWEGMAATIKSILQEGKDVLVACLGGHGRSGLFVSIVGYILGHKTNRAWKSPVEHIRQIHCDEAVETYAQEKYVYDILGLNIKINHVFGNDFDYGYSRGTVAMYGDYAVAGSTFKLCPICGTQSLFVDDYGMCNTCMKSYQTDAPVRDDLTLQDIENKGLVNHSCPDDKCMGIWTASKCGHTVHNQIIYEGLCENCYNEQEKENSWADKHEEEHNPSEPCALCGKSGVSSDKFGICFECSSKLIQGKLVDQVHNTITDPYKHIAHSNCDDHMLCVGIVQADVCQHVVHNREVEDGMCPSCFELKNGGHQ